MSHLLTPAELDALVALIRREDPTTVGRHCFVLIDHITALEDRLDDLVIACGELTALVPQSVEYSDWPELQAAVERVEAAAAKAKGATDEQRDSIDGPA